MLDKEANWCRGKRHQRHCGDIVPFAFEVAKKAGIPSVAVTNFTWHSFMRNTRRLSGIFTVLGKIRQQYAMADLLLAMFPANEMPYFEKRVDTGPWAGPVPTSGRG